MRSGRTPSRAVASRCRAIEKFQNTLQGASASSLTFPCRRLLADLADELTWTARFAATTDDQWDRMAAMVRRDIAAGDTTDADA